MEGAFSFQQGSTLCVTDEEVQAQRRRFTCPRSHSKGTTRAWVWAVSSLPLPHFLGLTQHMIQSWSSVNIYRSNAESKSETLISLTASPALSPTHVISVLNKYLLPRHQSKGFT